MGLITIKEARRYSRDYESEAEQMKLFIAAAEEYIKGAVGDFDPADPEAKMLCGFLVCEFTDNRSMGTAEKNSRSKVIESLILHLKLKPVEVSNSDTGEDETDDDG